MGKNIPASHVSFMPIDFILFIHKSQFESNKIQDEVASLQILLVVLEESVQVDVKRILEAVGPHKCIPPQQRIQLEGRVVMKTIQYGGRRRIVLNHNLFSFSIIVITFNLNFIIILIFNIVLIYILVLILDLVPIIIVYTVLLLCLYLNSINTFLPVFSNWVLIIVYLINTTIDNTMFPWQKIVSMDDVLLLYLQLPPPLL